MYTPMPESSLKIQRASKTMLGRVSDTSVLCGGENVLASAIPVLINARNRASDPPSPRNVSAPEQRADSDGQEPGSTTYEAAFSNDGTDTLLDSVARLSSTPILVNGVSQYRGSVSNYNASAGELTILLGNLAPGESVTVSLDLFFPAGTHR